MASRYDQHAQLIEERFQRGESFTSIARHLHEHFAIPQDASGLRRWILRRIAKREQRLAILSPTISREPGQGPLAKSVEIQPNRKNGESTPQKNNPHKDEAEENSEPQFSIKDVIAEAEEKTQPRLLKK